MSGATLFVLGDGDKVRQRLDALLFTGKLEDLKELSRAISEAVLTVAQAAASAMGGEIVVAGGDDLLLRIPADQLNLRLLEQLRRSFHDRTGCCTMSMGAAPDVERAYLNLRRAKAQGGDTLVASEPT